MAKLPEIENTLLQFAEAAAPSTPSAGVVRIYAKADGTLYSMDDAGTETSLSAIVEHTARWIAFYIDGDLTTALEASFVAPCALTITNVKSSVGTAPTDADLILDIHKNGTTVFTTQGNRPTIAAGETTDDSAAPDVTTIAAGDRITIQIDQIGSTVPGANLGATVVCVAV